MMSTQTLRTNAVAAIDNALARVDLRWEYWGVGGWSRIGGDIWIEQVQDGYKTTTLEDAAPHTRCDSLAGALESAIEHVQEIARYMDETPANSTTVGEVLDALDEALSIAYDLETDDL